MPKIGTLIQWGAIGFVAFKVYEQYQWMAEIRAKFRMPESPGGDEDVFGGGAPGPSDNPWGEGF